MLLWGGESVSLIGSRVSIMAVPTVAILALHSGAGTVGTLVALQWLPFLVLGPIAGVWIDRRARRPIMIATNVGRAVLMGLIPLGWALGVLQVWHLYVIAALSGVLTVLFQVAFRAYLPTLLDRQDFIEGNVKLQLSQSVAQVAGTPIAGALIGALGAAAAVVADAASYVVASLTLGGIRKTEPPPPSTGHGIRSTLSDLGAGLSTTWKNGILRNLAAMATLGNIALSMASAVMLVYLYEDLHLGPAAVGVALGIGSLGFVVGALASRRVTTRLGVGPTLLICSVILGLGYLILPLASNGAALVVVTVSQFLVALQAGPVNVGIMTAVQTSTPPQMMGRVAGISLSFVWGGSAIGGALGGVLGATLGNTNALLVSGAVGLLSAAFVLGPVLRFGRVDAVRPDPTAVQHPHLSLGSYLPWHLIDGEHLHVPWHFADGPAIARFRSHSAIGGPH